MRWVGAVALGWVWAGLAEGGPAPWTKAGEAEAEKARPCVPPDCTADDSLADKWWALLLICAGLLGLGAAGVALDEYLWRRRQAVGPQSAGDPAHSAPASAPRQSFWREAVGAANPPLAYSPDHDPPTQWTQSSGIVLPCGSAIQDLGGGGSGSDAQAAGQDSAAVSATQSLPHSFAGRREPTVRTASSLSPPALKPLFKASSKASAKHFSRRDHDSTPSSGLKDMATQRDGALNGTPSSRTAAPLAEPASPEPASRSRSANNITTTSQPSPSRPTSENSDSSNV